MMTQSIQEDSPLCPKAIPDFDRAMFRGPLSRHVEHMCRIHTWTNFKTFPKNGSSQRQNLAFTVSCVPNSYLCTPATGSASPPAASSTVFSLTLTRCQVNVAHTRQSRPGSLGTRGSRTASPLLLEGRYTATWKSMPPGAALP